MPKLVLATWATFYHLPLDNEISILKKSYAAQSREISCVYRSAYNSYLNGWRPYIQLFILTTTFFYKLQLYNLRIPWILLELIPPTHTNSQ